MTVKLPNSNYIPKLYQQIKYSDRYVQIEVKFVPLVFLVYDEKGKEFYQYTAIDEYSRYLYLKAFK